MADFVFAWACPSPSRSLSDWEGLVGEDLTDWSDIVDCIDRRSSVIDYETFAEKVGGEQVILENLWADSSVYSEEGGLKIADDWSVSWHESTYPDGTPVLYFVHSGIEHVFEPRGYKGPKKANGRRRNNGLSFRDEPSPLDYHGHRPQRLSLVDSTAPPPDAKEVYFAQTTKKIKYSPTGRTLKTPKTEVVPGASPGVVAWVDYDAIPGFDSGAKAGKGRLAIHYVTVRRDQRGKGLMRKLLDELLVRNADLGSVDFGEVHSPTVWKYAQELRAIYEREGRLFRAKPMGMFNPKSGDDDEEPNPADYMSFMSGDCWLLAVALREVTGLDVFGAKDDAGLVHHAFVATKPTGVGIDYRGQRSVADLLSGCRGRKAVKMSDAEIAKWIGAGQGRMLSAKDQRDRSCPRAASAGYSDEEWEYALEVAREIAARKNPFQALPKKFHGRPAGGTHLLPGFHTAAQRDQALPYAHQKGGAMDAWIDEPCDQCDGDSCPACVARYRIDDYPVVVAVDMSGLEPEHDVDARHVLKNLVDAARDALKSDDPIRYFSPDASNVESETPSSVETALFQAVARHEEDPAGSFGSWLEDLPEDKALAAIKTVAAGGRAAERILMDVIGQFRYLDDVSADRIVSVYYVTPFWDELLDYQGREGDDDLAAALEAAGWEVLDIDDVYTGSVHPKFTHAWERPISPNARIEWHGTGYRNLLSAAPELAKKLPKPPLPYEAEK